MLRLPDLLRFRRPEVEFIAFGTFCHAAATLRRAGLRRWSGPFDWLFSSPGMLADCLADDCRTLLDPRHLRSVPAGELTGGAKRQCRHVLFEERYGVPTVFNHHDPAARSDDARKLRRAAARLGAALGEPGRNLLVQVSEVPSEEPDAGRLRRALAALPSDNTLLTVVVRPLGTRARRTERRRQDGLDVIAVELDTLTRSTGAAFPDPADEDMLRAVLAEAAGSERLAA